MRREIQSAYGLAFPRIPGKQVKFSQEDGGSTVEVEVFASGESVPEWSAEDFRLEGAIAAVHRRYGLADAPTRGPLVDEDKDL